MSVCLSLCPSISIETTCGATAERLHFKAKQQRVTAVGQSQMHSKGDGKSAFRNQSTTTTKDMLICTPDYSAAGPVKIRRGEGGAELQKKVILHLNSVHIVFDPWHRKFTLCNLLHRLINININIQDQLSTSPKSPQRYAINVSVSLCLIDLMDWAAAAGGFPRLLLLFPSNWKFYSS